MTTKTDLIKLDGTILKSDGTSIKSNYFKFLELLPDDYSDISYTPEEAVKIRAHMSNLSTGASAALPLICGGKAKCPFAERCPFCRIDIERRKADPSSKLVTPIGRQCLVEINLMNEWTRLYVVEYEIDETCWTEVQMVRELAEIELMLWRLNNNLAKPEYAELVQDSVVGVDREGNPLTKSEINSFIDAKERFNNRKSKLVKLMVGDRQEKYKREAALKLRDEGDPSSTAAQLKGQITRILREADKKVLALKEVEGSLIDVDPENATMEPTGDERTPGVLSPEDLIGEE